MRSQEPLIFMDGGGQTTIPTLYRSGQRTPNSSRLISASVRIPYRDRRASPGGPVSNRSGVASICSLSHRLELDLNSHSKDSPSSVWLIQPKSEIVEFCACAIPRSRFLRSPGLVGRRGRDAGGHLVRPCKCSPAVPVFLPPFAVNFVGTN